MEWDEEEKGRANQTAYSTPESQTKKMIDDKLINLNLFLINSKLQSRTSDQKPDIARNHHVDRDREIATRKLKV